MEEKTKTIAEIMKDLAKEYKVGDYAEKPSWAGYHNFGTFKTPQKQIDSIKITPDQIKEILNDGVKIEAPLYYTTTKSREKLKPKVEPFAYKAPEYKYYVSKMLNGKPYSYGGVESILRMDSDGEFSEINNLGKVSNYSEEDRKTCHKQLKRGQLIEAAPALVNKILGIIENGYYVPKKHPEGFGKGKSKYCVERSDSGWESVIISGRNPGIYHPAGSSAAKECDEFVKSGEWILAEVEQVVES